MLENETIELEVVFRGKPFDIEKVKMSTYFSPISIFKIGLSKFRYLKIIYLFGIIPIWRTLVSNLFEPEEVY